MRQVRQELYFETVMFVCQGKAGLQNPKVSLCQVNEVHYELQCMAFRAVHDNDASILGPEMLSINVSTDQQNMNV